MAIDFPASPTPGEIYQGYYWDNDKKAWKSQQAQIGAVITSSTTPTGAKNGDLWFNTIDGTLFVYFNDGISSYWTEIKANSALNTTLGNRATSLESRATALESGKANLSGGNTFSGNQIFNNYVFQNGQPAFSASKTGGWFTISPNNVVVFDSTQFNNGGHYNTSTGRFTAPVAGKYVFSFNYYTDGQRQASFRKNGSDYIPTDTAISMSASSGAITMTATYLFSLAAGDYIETGCRSGSTSLYFYAGHSWFSGYMVG